MPANLPLCAQARSEARRALFVTSALLLVLLTMQPARGAEFVTDNFRVEADSAATARHVGLRAEELRTALSEEWLGTSLEDWPDRCRVVVNTGSERLKGDTTYLISRGEVTRWRMELHGPLGRVLETLLPHEVVHTILASHFRRAIPRWADEGAALMAEDASERQRLWKLEEGRLLAGNLPPLEEVLAASEYPRERDRLRTFYVRGASLTEFLLFAGKGRFLAFVGTGIDHDWDTAVRMHYGFADVASLEAAWTEWMQNNRPVVPLEAAQLLAAGLQWPVAEAPSLAVVERASGRTAARSPDVSLNEELRPRSLDEQR